MKNLNNNLKNTLQKIFKKKKIKNFDSLKIGSFFEWDSLNHFNFLLQVEKDFKIRFKSKEFSTLKSIKEIKKSILEKIEK